MKKYRGFLIVMAASLVLATFWGYRTNSEKMQYQTFLQNSYKRAYTDLVTNVENIKNLLDKAVVSNSAVQSNSLMSQVWRQSFSASTNLGQLPISHIALSNTAKYLTQVGDFCYALSKQNAANKLPDDKQIASIEKLNQYAQTLLAELHALQKSIEAGKVNFGSIQSQGILALKKPSANAVDVKFSTMEKNYSDYPTLIYDGPFSQNVVDGKPKDLAGNDISLEQAKEAAKKFVSKESIGKIVETSSGKGVIQTYGLELIPTNNNRSLSISIDITKKGGHVLWMLNPRDVTQKKLTDQQASDKAKAFLKQQGFDNLQETYFLKNDNSTTITYVGTEAGILIYPDLIKVKVALDNGEIIGFDAYNYLMSHHKRTLPKPVLTEAQAKSKVTQRLTVDRVKLAVIPLPGDKEQLCYEFKGKYKNNDYFVYINAENGNEENILEIIKVENGTLTQ